MCLLCSVEFLCLAWRNDAVWFLYLVLKSLSLSTMYDSVVLFSSRVKCKVISRLVSAYDFYSQVVSNKRTENFARPFSTNKLFERIKILNE